MPTERYLAAQRLRSSQPAPSFDNRVMMGINCSSGGAYYLLTCSPSSTVCPRCGEQVQPQILRDADLQGVFNWHVPIAKMGLAEMMAFIEAFNVECKAGNCATTSPKRSKTAV